jgi:hypothetical protein
MTSILEDRLVLERVAITYKTLSRKLLCTTDKAKELMARFSEENPQFHALFYGESKDENGNMKISFVNSSQTKELLHVHIYSLHPSNDLVRKC